MTSNTRLNGIKCYNHRIQLSKMLSKIDTEYMSVIKSKTSELLESSTIHKTTHVIKIPVIVKSNNINITITHTSKHHTFVKKQKSEPKEDCSKIHIKITIGSYSWECDYVIGNIYDVLSDIVYHYNKNIKCDISKIIIESKYEAEPQVVDVKTEPVAGELPGMYGIYKKFATEYKIKLPEKSLYYD